MSNLKKIKSLFVQTVEETDSQNKESEKSSGASTPKQVAEFDQKIFDSLMKSLEEHNLPGEDYLEFMGALKAMENIQLDEKVKIQTVLATLSTKGLTAQKIKESADYYKKVLVEEQKQFYDELNAQINTQLKSKEKSIAELMEQNKTKTQQINTLTQEINKNQAKIESIQNSIKDADTKLKTAESNFKKTYEFVVEQINSNVKKISN